LGAEAEEYVSRLESALLLDPRARVLDFGCGFGFVAEALASKVRELFLWDSSVNMLNRARLNVAGHGNVYFLDLSDPEKCPRDIRFDIILVNSVIQYMDVENLSLWLGRWREMLVPRGRIVISDLIPPDYPAVSDFTAVLVFSAQRRFLLRAIWEGFAELIRYWKVRHAYPLLRVTRDDLQRWATAVGLVVQFLPHNLTCSPRRTAAILTAST